MRRILAILVSASLLLVLAPPVAAGDTSRPASTYDASVFYQSDPTLLGPGIHTRMRVGYGTDGSGQIAQIQGDGWENTECCAMVSSWSWAYEKAYSTEPAIGGISPTLKDAWVHSDTLAFQCWTPGTCPPMPPEIIVEVQWTATGLVTADVFPDEDDLGVEWLRISRSRPATATVELSYPAGGGPVAFPALLMGTSISSYNFVTTKR